MIIKSYTKLIIKNYQEKQQKNYLNLSCTINQQQPRRFSSVEPGHEHVAQGHESRIIKPYEELIEANRSQTKIFGIKPCAENTSDASSILGASDASKSWPNKGENLG